ncbi:MAG: hypothetical protein EOO65_04610, partial [Methanosarcinales archaeon]
MPATVLMLPLSSTRRMQWLSESAMYSTTPPLLALNNAETLDGLFIIAAVAGPPSPLKPTAPAPATVVIMPSSPTRRMRLLYVSAMYSTTPPPLALRNADTPRGKYI